MVDLYDFVLEKPAIVLARTRAGGADSVLCTETESVVAAGYFEGRKIALVQRRTVRRSSVVTRYRPTAEGLGWSGPPALLNVPQYTATWDREAYVNEVTTWVWKNLEDGSYEETGVAQTVEYVSFEYTDVDAYGNSSGGPVHHPALRISKESGYIESISHPVWNVLAVDASKKFALFTVKEPGVLAIVRQRSSFFYPVTYRATYRSLSAHTNDVRLGPMETFEGVVGLLSVDMYDPPLPQLAPARAMPDEIAAPECSLYVVVSSKNGLSKHLVPVPAFAWRQHDTRGGNVVGDVPSADYFQAVTNYVSPALVVGRVWPEQNGKMMVHLNTNEDDDFGGLEFVYFGPFAPATNFPNSDPAFTYESEHIRAVDSFDGRTARALGVPSIKAG